MVSNITQNNGTGFNGTVVTGTPKEQPLTGTEQNKELDALKKQAEEIAEILNGSKDSVEISDAARALSEAAKNSTAQTAQTTQSVDTPADDIPESTAAAEVEKTLDTREGRAEIAKDYNAVLEELRGQYGEEEAMRRFDEFMAAEGFEKVKPDGNNGFSLDGYVVDGRSTDPRSHFNAMQFHIESGESSNLRDVYGKYYTSSPHNKDSNLHLRSTIDVNGSEYLAETRATYAAGYSDDVLNAVDSFFNRNLDELQKDVGFDLAEEMKKHSPTNQISAVSVNRD